MEKIRELLEEAKKLAKSEKSEFGYTEFTSSGIADEIFSAMKEKITEVGGTVTSTELNESVGLNSYIDFDVYVKKDNEVFNKLQDLGFIVEEDDERNRVSVTISY